MTETGQFLFFTSCLYIIIYSLIISTVVVALPTKPEGYDLRPGAADAPFKIALFADLHFGEAESTEWGPLQDVNSTRVMSSVLDHETPGKEDCSFQGTQRLELMKNEIELNTLSHSRYGPKGLWPSVSNYVLQVLSSEDPKSAVAFLYFLDSGGGSYPEVISGAQAEWFRQKALEINPDSSVPEIIFWHIPSRVYEKVAPKFGIHKPCVGSLNEEQVAPQEAEMGMMKLLAERKSAKAIFVGHNHGLDWCCPHKELWLCFARHTGYGGYGNWDRGARIVEITQKPFSVKSWIRMEDGNVHSEVVLSP
ncbi:probable inactive purple acid phosphatase 16 isoform X3 [Malus sylvestris]|uniref:probable inactive purple acid phosphatase 16 isoform X3 n=1 Tax=Malus sylvestris TaxID=3752 RepID=UPI0021ABCBC6|nr:probable inactive purple acid phosphatase 16 isoform X3 [Malus sylvestris]